MKAQSVDPGLGMLVLAAFLIPLMGGQVAVEAVPLVGGPLNALNALFGGSELPTVSHFVLALLVVGAFAWMVLSRRVVQTPNAVFSATVAIFFSVLVVTTAFSSFKTLSVQMATEWLVYGFGLFTVVGLAGRRIGPDALMTGLFAGCVITALKGMREYGENKAIDPTWRIFGGWNNPNALAAMMLIGFFLGIGLMLTQERLKALAAGAGTIFIGIALLLTQSKGGLLALGGVGVLWAVLAGGLAAGAKRGGGALAGSLAESGRKRPQSKSVEVLRVGAVLAAVVLVGFLLQMQQRTETPASSTSGGPTVAAAGGGVTSRLFNAGESADQSAEFRRLLWRTSIDLIKRNPVGYGMGSFRFESGRPGLTTQTVFAHSSYFQLAVEGSVVLPITLLALLGVWLRLVFKGIRTLPAETRTKLLSVVAAIAAILAHSFIDSDFYYFGVGLSVFMLLGLALLLSADAVAPEFHFPAVRATAAAFGGCVLLSLAYFGFVEYETALARGALQTGDAQAAKDTLALLHGIAPMNGEAWYMSAQVATNRQDAIAAAQSAVDATPSTRNLRLLARVQTDAGQNAAAINNFDRALALDPHNLATLFQKAEVQRANGDTAGCANTLRKLIAVEGTSYFKVRSLPEMVPTETYEARIELADATAEIDEKRRLLREAVAGYAEFLKKTVPNVLRMAKDQLSYGGVTVTEAKEKLTRAHDAAVALAHLDENAGDAAAAAAANAAAEEFGKGI